MDVAGVRDRGESPGPKPRFSRSGARDGGDMKRRIYLSSPARGRCVGARPAGVTRCCSGRRGADRPDRRGRYRRRAAGCRGRSHGAGGSVQRLHGHAGARRTCCVCRSARTRVSVTLAGFRAYVDTAVQVRAASSTPMLAILSVGGYRRNRDGQRHGADHRSAPPEQPTRTSRWTIAGRRFPRRATRGSCCRPYPASSSTASTSAGPNRASSRTTWPRARAANRTPGPSTAS